MRLDRFLSRATGLSRSQAQQAIRTGEVTADGNAITDPSAHVPAAARLTYRNDRIAAPTARYIMLYKPAGYVCAAGDTQHRTVLELLESSTSARLHIAGRLDIDATGLLLLTDDGDWLHRVTSPRHKFPKIYRVSLGAALGADAESVLRRGVQLKNEPRPCQPVAIERISQTQVRIALSEGKYHQVKRMFAAVGNHVAALHREAIGAITLDRELPAGASRPLTPGEIASFDRPRSA